MLKTVMFWGATLIVTASVVVSDIQHDESLESNTLIFNPEVNITSSENIDMDTADTRTLCKDNSRICPRYLNRCQYTWAQKLCPKTCGQCVMASGIGSCYKNGYWYKGEYCSDNYYQKVHNHYVNMPCADGGRWSLKSCECSIHSSTCQDVRYGITNKCEDFKFFDPNYYKSDDCKGGTDNQRIIGGQEVHPKLKYPWIVALFNENDNPSIPTCGGSIIKDNWILSAAHCIGVEKNVNNVCEHDQSAVITVLVGDHNYNSEDDDINEPLVTKRYSVKNYVYDIYKCPNGPGWFDVMLLELDERIPFNDFISPISLPEKDERGKNGIVAGWGKINPEVSSDINPDVFSEILLEVSLPIYDEVDCMLTWQNVLYPTVTRPKHCSQLCAGGEPGKSTCRGDSGGPLMIKRNDPSGKYYILGVVSFNAGGHCARKGRPKIFTQVSHPEVLNWINCKIGSGMCDMKLLESTMKSKSVGNNSVPGCVN